MELAPEASTELAPEATTEQATEATTEQATEASTELATEATTELAPEVTTELAPVAATEPVSAPVIENLAEPIAEKVLEEQKFVTDLEQITDQVTEDQKPNSGSITEETSQANDSVTSADIDFLLAVDVKTATTTDSKVQNVTETSHQAGEVSKPQVDQPSLPDSSNAAVSSSEIDQLLFSSSTSETMTLTAVDSRNLISEKDVGEVSGQKAFAPAQLSSTQEESVVALTNNEFVDKLVSNFTTSASDVESVQNVVTMTPSVTLNDVNKVCDTNPPETADQVKVLSEPQAIFNPGFTPLVPQMNNTALSQPQLQPQPAAFVLPKPDEAVTFPAENQMQPKKRQKVR